MLIQRLALVEQVHACTAKDNLQRINTEFQQNALPLYWYTHKYARYKKCQKNFTSSLLPLPF